MGAINEGVASSVGGPSGIVGGALVGGLKTALKCSAAVAGFWGVIEAYQIIFCDGDRK